MLIFDKVTDKTKLAHGSWCSFCDIQKMNN